MRRAATALIAAVLGTSCGDVTSGPVETSSTEPSTTVPATVPPEPTVAVESAASRYGLPDVVSASIRAPELDLVLDISVSPSTSIGSDLSLFGRFASCSAVEGPDWLPFEVVVAEASPGPALRLVASGSNLRSDAAADIRIRIDDGQGRVIEASGAATLSDAGRSGTWSGVTADGSVISGTYSCLGEARHDSIDSAVEMSARLIDSSTGQVRTVGGRSSGEGLCSEGGTAGPLLSMETVDSPAGGLVASVIDSDRVIPVGSVGTGSLVLSVPGGAMRFSTVEISRFNGGGVLAGDDGENRRVDAAWTCR